MAPLGPFDLDTWTERHPAPATWAVRKRHGRVLRAFLAIVGIGALVAGTYIASDILRDWVSSGVVR